MLKILPGRGELFSCHPSLQEAVGQRSTLRCFSGGRRPGGCNTGLVWGLSFVRGLAEARSRVPGWGKPWGWGPCCLPVLGLGGEGWGCFVWLCGSQPHAALTLEEPLCFPALRQGEGKVDGASWKK